MKKNSAGKQAGFFFAVFFEKCRYEVSGVIPYKKETFI